MTWIYVMEETALPEGSMAPVYPLGVNVVIARIGGTLYAVSGKFEFTDYDLADEAMQDKI